MAKRGRLALTILSITAIGAGISACRPPIVQAACDGTLGASTAGTLTDPALIEVSGLAASSRNANTIWMHNDSGDTPRVFATWMTGATRVTYTVAGATANDWEDLALGPGPVSGTTYLYAGDIGDNGASRPNIAVYRFPEPTVSGTGAQTISGAAKLTLRYPDGSHDAEAMFVDPQTGELYVIQKSGAGGAVGIYRAPANLAAGSTTVMARVGTLTLPTGGSNAVTAADISVSGNAIAVRTYGAVRLYSRTDQTVVGALVSGPCSGPIPAESQGESIAFTPDERSYITISEGGLAALHRFSMP